MEKKLLDDQKKMKEMRYIEIKKYQTEIENIKNSLWQEYDRDVSLTNIEDTKGYLNDAKKISFLRKQIDLDLDIEEKYIEIKKKS